jgi:hypothetical protein
MWGLLPYTAPTQPHNRALFVGCLTRNLKPKTSFDSRVTKELQMPLAGFNLRVADTFCGLKPTIWVDCRLRFWSVCCSLQVSLAGCSSLLMGCQLRVCLNCLLWVSRLQVLARLSNGKSYSWQWSTALQQLLINNQLLLMLKLQSLATVFPIIYWVAAWLPVKKWCCKLHSLECRLPLSWLNNRMQLPLSWLNNIIHSCTSWIRQSLL